jgi:rod shape-determining protein MreD
MRLFPQLAGVVDLFLVAVVLNALGGDSLSALSFGFVAGLVHDSLTSGPFGLFGFADTLVGYLVARLAQRLVIQRASGVLGVVAFAAIVESAIVVLLVLVLLPPRELPSPLFVFARAGACGLVGFILHLVTTRFRRGLDARRRGRMSRLRIG